MVKISVIIPVYNVEQYLCQCLDSVINQTLQDIEIICVDDSSTDNSYRILQEYAQKDKRMMVLQQENAGAGIARNKGLAVATGEYIHFLDADDYMELDAYEKMYQAATQHDVDFLKAKVYGFDNATGSAVNDSWYSLSVLEKKDFGRTFTFLDSPQKFTKILVVPWNGIYKKTFLREHNIVFNDLVCVNDRSFYNNVLIHAKRFMFLDHYIVHYRLNNQTSLVGRRGKHFECHFQSYDLIRQQSSGVPAEEKAIILNAELADLFAWYRKYKNDRMLGGKIYAQTKAFLQQLEISEITAYIKHCGWYEEYMDILSEPKVSVVLTIYNVAPYLEVCLDGVIAQSHKNLEIICVDDGSTDHSPAILQQYASCDPRFRLITQENQGPGPARNAGLQYVTGEYVLLLDSDDLFEPEMIKSMVKELQNSGGDLAICQADAYNMELNAFQKTDWTLHLELLPKKKVITPKEIGKNLFQFTKGWAWDKLYRTSFIKTNGFIFPDLRNSEDLVFVFPTLAKAEKISIVRSVLVHHRIKRNTSVSNSRDADPFCFFEATKLLKEYLVQENLYQGTVKQSFVNWALDFALWNMNTLSDDKRREVYQMLKTSGFHELDIAGQPKTYFDNKQHYAQYQSIMKDSIEDYLYHRISLEQNVVSKSDSGVVVTKCLKVYVKIKQKIRGGIQCYYDHGFRYTVRRLLEKIILKLKNNK